MYYRLHSLTPSDDFVAGEIDDPDKLTLRRTLDGRIDGVQIQMLSFLGQTWGMGAPRFTADQVVNYSRKLWEADGAVTWDVPLEVNGKIPQAFLDQLTALKAASK